MPVFLHLLQFSGQSVWYKSNLERRINNFNDYNSVLNVANESFGQDALNWILQKYKIAHLGPLKGLSTNAYKF